MCRDTLTTQFSVLPWHSRQDDLSAHQEQYFCALTSENFAINPFNHTLDRKDTITRKVVLHIKGEDKGANVSVRASVWNSKVASRRTLSAL